MRVIGAISAVMAVVAVELGLAVLIRRLRHGFPWLLSPADVAPEIPAALVERHRSFDADLGWCRRPGERGTELTDRGETRYEVDGLGRRHNPGFAGLPAAVACFGDSYVFCRLVNDDETWPHQLSRLLGTNAANYGVGNYGLDQALLRLERELPGLEADVVVMGVVPETIARVHSYWKHYFEYGNVLAFKPRFTLESGTLVAHPPAVTSPDDYQTYREQLPHIIALDPFYHAKFRRDLLAFPYLPRLLLRARRHFPVLAHLVRGRPRDAFDEVLRDNARWTARLYADHGACELLGALVERFAAVCRAAGKHPVLLIVPQPADLDRDGGTAHRHMTTRLATRLPVVDVTDRFRREPDLFVHGKLGPHCGPRGNAVIASELRPVVEPLLEVREGGTHARQGA
ncbi:SGNH/GDSL hydrolase family protein [Lentzea sp. E54]|uniref:SGNH/GDSL hydrolase family protein n=1 Tax=Lentzea xerophila TaxID=3435883 RepID=UPI003DA4332D